jgi:hypothetical protein
VTDIAALLMLDAVTYIRTLEADGSQNPCDVCNLESLCDTYGYKESCNLWSQFQGEATPNVTCEKYCINCQHFKLFEGACKIHTGSKENKDTCEDFAPLEVKE